MGRKVRAMMPREIVEGRTTALQPRCGECVRFDNSWKPLRIPAQLTRLSARVNPLRMTFARRSDMGMSVRLIAPIQVRFTNPVDLVA